MDRRNFIRLATIGAGTGMIAPKLAQAKSIPMAGGLYYTKETPGRWGKKVGGHLPTVEVLKNSKGTVIKVTTAHDMNAYGHYIVKHIVLDENYQFLDEHMFDPKKDKAPVSQFSLGNYRGKIHVLSVCNKHDTWLNSATV